jgi:5'-nucleotidase
LRDAVSGQGQEGDALTTLKSNPLRIGVSTRALFDLEEEHHVFAQRGVQAYVKMQREREDILIGKGTGFGVVERLLALNDADKPPYVEVILLSQNSPDLSLRAFKAIDHYGLTIKTGSFTSGRSLAPYVPAWNIDLFLSNADADVKGAMGGGAQPRVSWSCQRDERILSPVRSASRLMAMPSYSGRSRIQSIRNEVSKPSWNTRPLMLLIL